MGLAGKKVLVTRAAGDAAAFARMLLECGLEPIVAPTIAIGPADDPLPARNAVREIARYAWLVFTARPGVDAFFANLREFGDVRALAEVKVAAIGPKTARHLEGYGIKADLVSARFTSDDVARDVLDRTREGDRILLYLAQENRDVLRSALERGRRNVTAVAAYKTRIADDPAFARKVALSDVVTFTSGSTVRGFAALLGGNAAAAEAARDKTVVCIGPITAGEARDAGLHVDVVGEEFTAEGLVAALKTHFTSHT